MVAGNVWTGGNVRKARAYVRARLPLPCQDGCGKPVLPGQDFVVGHIEARWKRPDLILTPSNWSASHAACSDRSGQAHVIAKARAEGASGRVSGGGTPLAVAATDPISLSEELEPTVWPAVVGMLPWMADLAEIPPDATPPRYMTGPHPDAVGSYGPDFCAWVDETPGLHPRKTTGLRWFQRVVAYRVLEHDREGRLVWRNVLITLARQLGKSWLLRALICWRIQHPELFEDEDQTVVYMAHRMPTANEVWRPAARWAVSQDWHVRWANGEQLIEAPDGGRWMIKAATDGVGVGFALSVIVCDESWMVPRSVIEAADPALSESISPQLLLVSTAGDSASDLFGTYRNSALAQLDAPGNTLIVEWSAPKALSPEDPVAWRMASPHWSERRESEILDKLSKLEALEFAQNFLNIWVDVAHGRPKEPGLPVFAESEWAELNGVTPPATPPAVTAIEGWFSDGVSVASAWPLAGGQVLVRVSDHRTVAEAARSALSASAPVLLVGKSLASDPAFATSTIEPTGSTTKQAITQLRQYVDDDVLRHDGSTVLTSQALALRTLPGADGPRVRSTGRADALKAASWCLDRARQATDVPAIF
jgi:hypothetical protein